MTRPTVTVQGVEDLCRLPHTTPDEAIGAAKVLQRAGWDVEWLSTMPDTDGTVAVATVRHPGGGDLVGHLAYRAEPVESA